MKRIGSAAAAAMALAIISTSAFAMDGQFFVAGSVGQSNFNTSYIGNQDKTDTQGALRLGYSWRSGPLDYGVEAGYADLGKTSASGSYTGLVRGVLLIERVDYRNQFSAKGGILGGNLKYNIGSWYVSGHAGWFRAMVDSQFDATYTPINNPLASTSYSHIRGSSTSTNQYVGVGGGLQRFQILERWRWLRLLRLWK